MPCSDLSAPIRDELAVKAMAIVVERTDGGRAVASANIASGGRRESTLAVLRVTKVALTMIKPQSVFYAWTGSVFKLVGLVHRVSDFHVVARAANVNDV